MKHLATILLATGLAISAKATSYTFTPSPADLNDLSHDNTYTWGINSAALKNQLASGYYITSATISIANLYNWDVADVTNQLFIHLLDNPKKNVKSLVDNAADQGVNQGTVSDYFSGNIPTNNGIYYGSGGATGTYGTNIYLTQYHDADGPTTHINYSYSFTGSQISTLTAYIGNAVSGGTSYYGFGLGFDPDCHYYNDGVTFSIETSDQINVQVPDESVTLALLGFGFLTLAASRRFFRN